MTGALLIGFVGIALLRETNPRPRRVTPDPLMEAVA